jgi:hypothetical protein
MINRLLAAGCWRRGLIDVIPLANETLLVHTGEGAALRIKHGRLIRGRGYDKASGAARHELARLGAMLRLRSRGRFHIHASGAVDPTGRAVLLTGDSGGGKSTLAYALARAGWPALGDDGILIERRNQDLLARAWREPLQVSVELAWAFPELREHTSDVNWSDERHRIPMPLVGPKSAPVGALIFVRRSTRDDMYPLPQTEALAALVRQSSAVLIADAYAAQHLALLCAIVASVPSFCLEHTSRQLHTVSQTISESLSACTTA